MPEARDGRARLSLGRARYPAVDGLGRENPPEAKAAVQPLSRTRKPRVREYAQQMVELDAEVRREFREALEAEQIAYELGGELRAEDADPSGDELPSEDSDLPF